MSTLPQTEARPGAGVRLLRGLGAVLLLAVLLVGIPLGLWVFGGPVLTGPVTWDAVVQVLTTPDVTGAVLLGVIKVVGWLAWATFAVAVLVEVVAALRGRRSPRLRGLGVQQRAAAVLVGAVVTMLVAAPGAGPAVAATGPTTAEPAQPVLVAAEVFAASGEVVASPAVAADPATTSPEAATTSAEAPTYTVKPGDSLWRIAEETLGDGARFKEIANLNYGVAQVGGGALGTSHWIEPGWVLTLPAGAASAAPTADTAEGTHVVVRGDTLWDIAEERLGDGTRYPELYEASKGTVQPDGERLVDPDLILPGWNITVPGAADGAAQTDAPAPAEPAPAQPTPQEPAPARPAPEPAPAEPGGSPDAGAETTSDAQAPADVTKGGAFGDRGEATAAPEGTATEAPAAPGSEQPSAPAAEEPPLDSVQPEDLTPPVVEEPEPGSEAPAPAPAPTAEEPGPAPTAEAPGAGVGAPSDEALPVPSPEAAPSDESPAEQFPEVKPEDLADDPTLEPADPGKGAAPGDGLEGVDPFEDDALAPELRAPETTEPAPMPAPEPAPETSSSSGAGTMDLEGTPDTTVPGEPGAGSDGPAEGAADPGAADETAGAAVAAPTSDTADGGDTAPAGATDEGAAPEAAPAPGVETEPGGADEAAAGSVLAELPATTAEPQDEVLAGAPSGSEGVGATPEAAESDPALASALADADLLAELDEGFDVRTASGIGGLLAAGVLALVAARRANTRRRRKVGERVAVPEADSPAGVLEQQLRAVADPFGREQVDLALRGLAAWHRERALPMPGVRVARLKSGELVQLFLDQPAYLPAPWASTTDRYVWQLAAADAVTLPVTAGEAPYPSLVTVGQDDEDAHLMLDLENVGCLDIRGTDDRAQAVLAGLAIELATSLWADDLQVTVVGALGDLPGVVDTGRVRHVPTLTGIVRELEARAASVEQTLAQVEASSIADARGRGLAMDAWTPEILLVGERLGNAERTALEALVHRVPGVGIAAVTSSADLGEWALDLSGELTGGDTERGVLVPAYIAVRPQQLDAGDYARTLELLGEPETVPGRVWGQGTSEVLGVVTPVRTAAPDGAVPAGHDASTNGAAREALAVDRAASEAPVRGGETEAEAAVGPGAAAAVVATNGASTNGAAARHVGNPWVDRVEPRPSRTPVVRVLGPVELAGVAGTPLPASHQRQAMELVAYLAFNPGARGADISRALWPSREPNLATRRSAVSRARRWLGVDAYGYEYLPRYWSSDDGAQVDQESAGYRLRGVSTDWDQFCELVGPDVTATPLEDLRAALALVRGRAFEDAPARKYTWAETLLQEITAGVVDVAHEVARRALAVGDIGLAREASRVGRMVDPVDERSWRNSIRAELADRKPEAVGRLVDRLRDHLEQLELEPEPETEDLISKVHALVSRKPG